MPRHPPLLPRRRRRRLRRRHHLRRRRWHARGGGHPARLTKESENWYPAKPTHRHDLSRSRRGGILPPSSRKTFPNRSHHVFPPTMLIATTAAARCRRSLNFRLRTRNKNREPKTEN